MPIVGKNEKPLLTNLAEELQVAMRKGLITPIDAWGTLLRYAGQRHRGEVEPDPVKAVHEVWRQSIGRPLPGSQESSTIKDERQTDIWAQMIESGRQAIESGRQAPLAEARPLRERSGEREM